MTAPVVVGFDGSPRNLSAVASAADEAAQRHRALRIVHVYTLPPVSAGADPMLSARYLRSCRGLAEDNAAEAARLAARCAPSLTITTRLLPGPVVPALLAESLTAALLVLGDRGRGGLADLVLSSAALPVAKHAACPVLVVRGQSHPHGPVVVGIDGGVPSAPALAFAADEAVRHDGELVALHAWTGDGSEEKEAWMLAEALAGTAVRYPALRIRPQVQRGSARRLLTDWSAAAQLVVIGRRSHGGFTGRRTGSIRHHLVHRADCPVAVVQPHD